MLDQSSGGPGGASEGLIGWKVERLLFRDEAGRAALDEDGGETHVAWFVGPPRVALVVAVVRDVVLHGRHPHQSTLCKKKEKRLVRK